MRRRRASSRCVGLCFRFAQAAHLSAGFGQRHSLHFPTAGHRARTVMRQPSGLDRFCRWLSPACCAHAGLFRVIAWVLNGLELDVHNATLETDEHGTVRTARLTCHPGVGLHCHGDAVCCRDCCTTHQLSISFSCFSRIPRHDRTTALRTFRHHGRGAPICSLVCLVMHGLQAPRQHGKPSC